MGLLFDVARTSCAPLTAMDWSIPSNKSFVKKISVIGYDWKFQTLKLWNYCDFSLNNTNFFSRKITIILQYCYGKITSEFLYDNFIQVTAESRMIVHTWLTHTHSAEIKFQPPNWEFDGMINIFESQMPYKNLRNRDHHIT